MHCTVKAENAALNPYATPYLPLSSILAGGSTKEENKVTEKALKDSEKEETAELQALLADLAYDIHSADNAGTTEKSGSEMAQHAGVPAILTLPHEAFETESNGVMHERPVDYLASMFPDLCGEFLADILSSHSDDIGATIDTLEDFNIQDVGATIDMLEEVKLWEDEDLDPERFPELSEALYDLYFPSLEGRSCDEHSPTKTN